jgi:hypothetical protein
LKASGLSVVIFIVTPNLLIILSSKNSNHHFIYCLLCWNSLNLLGKIINGRDKPLKIVARVFFEFFIDLGFIVEKAPLPSLVARVRLPNVASMQTTDNVDTI